MISRKIPLLLCLGALLSNGVLHAQTDLQKSLKDTGVGAHWIYDDIHEGFAQAKATKKPLLVLFR